MSANVDRIADIWGERTPHARGTVWPARVDLHLQPGVSEADVDRWVGSACVLCSNGCGCEIAVKDGRMVGVRGRATDTVNHGRMGPKGLYGSWDWATSKDRLTEPLIRVDGELRPTDWDTAMGRIVEVRKRLLADKGPLSHGFYTSGQLFIEEYYTLAVIGKAGIGTPHMDGNTPLHSDRWRGPEGELRQRRPARLVHRYRARRRHLLVRPQHAGDPDRAVDAHP